MPAMDSLVTARVHPCHTRCSSYPFKSSSNRRARRGELDSRGMSSCQDLKDFVRLPFNHQHRRAPILRPPSAGPISSGCHCDECRYGRNSKFPPRALGLGPIFVPRRRLDVVGRVEDCSFSNSMARGHKLTSRTTVGGPIKSSAVTTSTTRNERQDGPSSSDPVIVVDEESPALQLPRIPLLARWKPPRYLWRSLACLIVAGQVTVRMLRGKIHVRNSIQQLEIVGPKSLGVSLLTASFVGMVFTIQFVREFARLGLTRSVGGVLALALARELAPVVTAIILAGRVGSAFAAELGTMQVSEQTDTLRVLRTDPVDYLITPRVLACCISLPVLTLICFSVAMAASVLLADAVYNVSSNIILESAARALQPWDLISTSIKATVFGGIISIVSCSWGVTTVGGAKGVGESTTSAVVISLVCIFIADFILSWCFFQGSGDALKAAMG